MGMSTRIGLCIGILALDLILFFLPLTAFFLVYIILYNPPWFRDFLHRLEMPATKRH